MKKMMIGCQHMEPDKAMKKMAKMKPPASHGKKMSKPMKGKVTHA